MIRPVILCGGSGTRLWPLSRELYPKQLFPLLGEKTMLQETVARLEGLEEAAEPLLLCNENHRFMIAEQLRAMGVTPEAIVLEPASRNTAPALAVAALHAVADGLDPLLLILPADHALENRQRFYDAVRAGSPLAEAGDFVTFGVVPGRPETGYGYIKKGESLGDGGACRVEAFVEKPDLARAEEYLASGRYLWNSGIFLIKASRYLEELDRHAPQMAGACRAAFEGRQRDLDFVRLMREPYEACPSDSIDYALMERIDRAAVVPLDAAWSDLGSFAALHDLGERDGDGNRIMGDVVCHDVRDCYLRSEDRLVAALGVDGLVVVETADAVLVASRDRVQDVKAIVSKLKKKGREETVSHRRVYRPWGSYEGVDRGERFQVKRITVNPGAVLSLQMHHHRAEHWVVVRGVARITKNDEVFTLREDESTYIPQGSTHRLENPGKIPLELIEVQTGAYLGEDDIVRFNDAYGRDSR